MRYSKRPDPTPEQINERAAEIRRRWADEDYRRRAQGSVPGRSGNVESWLPPIVAEPDSLCLPAGPSIT